MGAAMVLSEYYLATQAAWVLPELQEIHDFIAAGQYLDMAQINPKSKESHPDAFPKGPRDSHGGWGHNPGFEGYGPIAMITAQGALAYSMMARCGITIDRTHHDAAYEFLKKGSGANGYVWYGDSVGGGADGWADMGRTGAAAIANSLSPYPDVSYRDRARLHSKVIGLHPQSFPTRMDRQRWAWPTARSVHMSIQRTFVNSWTQIGGGSHSPNAATELSITSPTETMRAMALTLG